ncbi:cytochrome c oxidase assembly factor Coa1 family protein [Egbenema bharatensis]|uniref:cytochrome c oxidase assembly factor Coa1 family protein n=1 Tax=Egbenema bharatensis TaxID=3463334 RepID=UPI003A8942D5
MGTLHSKASLTTESMTVNGQSEQKPQTRSWLLPIGLSCLGCLGMVGIAIFLGAAGFVSVLQGLIKSTGTYQTYQIAAERVKTDDAVSQTLGDPVSTGWLSKSREFSEGETRRTCIRFSVTGSQTSGSVYAETQFEQGSWQFHQLIVSVNGQPNPIALITPAPNQPPFLCPDFDRDDSREIPATQV